MSEEKIVKTLCRMCDDHCGIDVHVKDGKVVKIEGNREHEWNHGRLCIKGSHGVEMIYAKDRIHKPLKKTENGFVEISLEQALDEICEKLGKIRDEYGARSIGVWKGEATGFAQEEELARRWIHALGSSNYFSNDSECSIARLIGASLVYGRWSAQPNYPNSRCIVIWGSNPPHAHPNMTQQINAAREKGAKLIVIDPRYSAMARQADIYVQVKPGSDGALAHGIARELIAHGWIDREFIDNYSVGYDKYEAYVQKFDYAYVSGECGIDAAALIPQIAAELHKAAPRVAIYVGNGLEHHENGINNIRAVFCLDGLLGSVDAEGGNYFSVPSGQRSLTIYNERPLLEQGPIGVDKYPVLYDYHKECHTMTLMDTILSGKPYPFKALVMTAANPVLTNPNTPKVKKALASLDLFVVRDLFLTETAQLADYVLPAASYLERSELHTFSGLQKIALTSRVLQPEPDVQDEYQFFHDTAHRLGAGEWFPWKDEDELNEWLVEDCAFTIEDLKNNPSGYHYAEHQFQKYKANAAAGKKPFNTPTGKMEFACQYLKDLGYQELPEYFPPRSNASPSAEYPFTLVTGARKVMYYHGRNHNLPGLASAMPDPEIEMNPQDAERLHVASGDAVRVTSAIGSIEIPVAVMQEGEIGVGVVQITHGWKQADVNRITHDDRFDPISGFPLMKAVQVKIEKV